jgi:hypothetical protein
MRLTSEQVERTLSQFEGQPIPEDHPVVPQLSKLFGDHTFFLDGNGLNVVEPTDDGARTGTVVNLADWANADLTSLAPHEPQPTDVIVEFDAKH